MEQDIFSKIDTAKTLDFGSILSRSFDMVKHVWQEALMHTLLAFAIALPIILLILIPILPMYIELIETSAQGYGAAPEVPFDSFATLLLYMLLVVVGSFALQVFILSTAPISWDDHTLVL